MIRRALEAGVALSLLLALAADAAAQTGTRLRLVTLGNFASPLYAVSPPGDPSRVMVVERTGRGGYVVRDPELPRLAGRYLYSDLCDGRIWATRLRTGTAPKLQQLSSFGEDASRRIYVMSILGAVYRIAAAR